MSGGGSKPGAVSYAGSAVGVLREYFPSLADPMTIEIITEAIRLQEQDPQDSFEVIVDDPRRADWRLKACSEDRRRVRLACFRMNERDVDVQLAHTVNGALSALETAGA